MRPFVTNYARVEFGAVMTQVNKIVSESQHREEMQRVIERWVNFLQSYPGWTEWNHRKIGSTLFHSGSEGSPEIPDFILPPDIDLKHAAIMAYLQLAQTIQTLKGCEYYFRRYPFRNLPVTHYDHLTNICEMYFAKFYEFRERLKKFEKALTAISPNQKKDWGPIIKLFDKIFDQEIRARNKVNHSERFSHFELDQIFLLSITFQEESDAALRRRHLVTYRKFTNDWVARVRAASKKVDQILELIAAFTLAHYNLLPELMST
jgi:hypothetical protein